FCVEMMMTTLGKEKQGVNLNWTQGGTFVGISIYILIPYYGSIWIYQGVI
ncbi:hypothetical protein GGR06_000867, partial [Bacteroides reticulotermitis]|nr:hypothetical protein [Bacteroides reticulotermitis]